MDKTPSRQPTQISHLQLRAIQAPIAACLIKEFVKTIGFKKALEVATVAIQSDALTAGKRMAEKSGSNTLGDLARLVREIWSKDGAMTVEFLVETDETSISTSRAANMPSYIGNWGFLSLDIASPAVGMTPL